MYKFCANSIQILKKALSYLRRCFWNLNAVWKRFLMLFFLMFLRVMGDSLWPFRFRRSLAYWGRESRICVNSRSRAATFPLRRDTRWSASLHTEEKMREGSADDIGEKVQHKEQHHIQIAKVTVEFSQSYWHLSFIFLIVAYMYLTFDMVVS